MRHSNSGGGVILGKLRIKVLHEKFQFWRGGGILGKLRTKVSKSSMRSSNSGVEGILGKLRTEVLSPPKEVQIQGGAFLVSS